jgi:hypothetical protein
MSAGVGERPTPPGLSQQSGEAEGSLTLEVQGRVGSSPDNDGTCQYRQMARARLARSRGATEVNQWLNPLKCGTGSNLVDVGRAAVRVVFFGRGQRLRSRSLMPVSRPRGMSAAYPVARLQRQSWASIRSTGTW